MKPTTSVLRFGQLGIGLWVAAWVTVAQASGAPAGVNTTSVPDPEHQAFLQTAPPAGSGLLPPPPPPTPESVQTLRQLEQAERADSGRGLQFVWLEPEVAFQWMALTALKDDGLAESLDTSGIGAVIGAGAGLRLLYLTAGARFRYLLLAPFRLWSLGFEAALRVPRGRWEPYGALGVGYVAVPRFVDDSSAIASEVSASGLSTRLGGGIDYYVTPVFSIGMRADFEFLFTWRPAISGAEARSAYATKGSGIGVGASASLMLGLHF